MPITSAEIAALKLDPEQRAAVDRQLRGRRGSAEPVLRLVCVLPLRLMSEANMRENWRKKATRAKAQRGAASFVVTDYLRGRSMALPLRCTLTRYGPRVMDSDNITISFKAVRDGIADAIGMDDGDARWEWRYEQERSKTYSVRIDLETISPAAGGGAKP